MRISRFIVLALGILLGTATPGMADGLLPDIPEAQNRFSDTQGCVEPTADMRRNHMNYLLHQRDETVQKGIRTKQHSLEQCINCHVPEGDDAPRHSSEEHFCNSCHSYAAVNIDCFQCHVDRPLMPDYLHSLAPVSKPHHLQTDAHPETLTPTQIQALVDSRTAP